MADIKDEHMHSSTFPTLRVSMILGVLLGVQSVGFSQARPTPTRTVSIAAESRKEISSDTSPPDLGGVSPVPESETNVREGGSATSSPQDVQPDWWLAALQQPLRADGLETTPLMLSAETAIIRAVQNSSQIKVFSDLPLIRVTAVTEANAAFDWNAFIESRWNSLNDPVGSALTGATNRYEDRNLTTTAGIRRRTIIGSKIELHQRAGIQDTNSSFFQPDPQGTARLTLNYTQPLLRGRGRVYNESLICLAILDRNVAEAEFSRQVQSHIAEVFRAYWGLYVSRATYVQKARTLESNREIIASLEKRGRIDASVPQLRRAEAEVALLEAEVARAVAAIKNSESRLRSLVNDPELGDWKSVELIPTDVPMEKMSEIPESEAYIAAAQFRPEVEQSLKQIHSASKRYQMSQHELMPILNGFVETYAAGLQDNSSVGDAWTDQFRSGRPSFALGVESEAPLGNRAANARRTRRQLELRQLQKQYQTTLASLHLEVAVSLSEVATSHAEMVARRTASAASLVHLETVTKRWMALPGDDGQGALMLENMLRAQDRHLRQELLLAESQATYNLALVMLRKATGELLQSEQVTWMEYHEYCESLRTRVLTKPSTIPGMAD